MPALAFSFYAAERAADVAFSTSQPPHANAHLRLAGIAKGGASLHHAAARLTPFMKEWRCTQVKSRQASEVEYAAAVASYMDSLGLVGGSLRRRSTGGLGESSASSLVQVPGRPRHRFSASSSELKCTCIECIVCSSLGSTAALLVCLLLSASSAVHSRQA